MYLTGGQYKGYKVEVPKTAKPTLSKVRESIFNMLFSLGVTDGAFLDMFAGSAIMALEAYSRGYSTTAIEKNPKSVSLIKKNCEKFKDIEIFNIDSMKFKPQDRYDIIYIDPPWEYNYEPIIAKAQSIAKENGIIIIESDDKRPIDIKTIINSLKPPLDIVKSKKYGRVIIHMLRNVKK